MSVWPSGDLVATVEIGRPPDNFFDAELITALADAYAWLDGQPEFRAVVLCSEGKHFCAGADFTGRSGGPRVGGAKELYAAAARLFEVRTPVVAPCRARRWAAGSGWPAPPTSGWPARRPGSARTSPGSACITASR